MTIATVGLLHPGAMGAAVGKVLTQAGRTVLWASERRGARSADRAAKAGLEDAGTAAEMAARSDLVLAICPPHGALDTARSIGPFTGLYVDANAVSPATADEIRAVVQAAGGRYVDGGIIGPPPAGPEPTARLYLSGPDAPAVAEVFAATALTTPVLDGEATAASALKMAYAGWTKGTAALLLTMREAARAHGVEEALVREWEHSIPSLPDRSAQAARQADEKGWRWVAEMREIAATLAAADLPAGFHEAAAEVFERR
jgi:3-hydroxyisobutyrate dehydrogenase-like beta-hydroxyacid dehydrogenase